MKAFRIYHQGEEFIVAAETNVGALRHMMMTMQLVIDLDFDGTEEIEKIPEKNWDGINIRNGEYDKSDLESKPEHTLRELMEGLTNPDLLGSTVADC